MTMAMIDAEARRRIAEDLDTTFVVEAAAGTGKTSALVGRIVAVLARGAATLPGILAVTFTEKAAGEMKLRLRAELEKARERASSDGEPDRLVAALADLEAARVGTIHSLCADLLREHPVAAGVDPKFEMLAEDEMPRVVEAAFEAWFEAELAAPGEGVRRILRRRPRGRHGLTPRRELLLAARKRIEHRDHTTAWRRDPFDRAA